MATEFNELFRREQAFWQIDALQDIIDHGQDVMYAGLAAAFTELWTQLVPGVDKGFKGLVAWLHAQVPESAHSTYAMAGAIRQWADFEMGERLEQFRMSVVRWLHRTVSDSARMFGEKAQVAAGRFSPAKLQAELRFSAVNREAMDWAERRSGSLITGIDNVMRKNIGLILANGQAGNATPVQMARDIYDFIPLLPQHTAALIKNRQTMLANGMKRKAVGEITAANAMRYRRYRSMNIARTETVMANNVGVDAYIRDKQDKGLLPGSSVRVWIATRDDRTCERCAPMHGKTAPIDGMWKAPGPKAGTEMMLPIPPLHPSCRCAIAVFTPELHTEAEIEEMWAPIHA